MKKSIFIILPTFTLGNAIFLSLGMTCLLDLLSISVGISLDSEIEYPRFIPFCMILGIVALIGVIFLLFGNVKISERLKFTKRTWYFQYIFAFVLSIPMIKLWQMLFDFLQETIQHLLSSEHTTQKGHPKVSFLRWLGHSRFAHRSASEATQNQVRIRAESRRGASSPAARRRILAFAKQMRVPQYPPIFLSPYQINLPF